MSTQIEISRVVILPERRVGEVADFIARSKVRTLGGANGQANGAKSSTLKSADSSPLAHPSVQNLDSPLGDESNEPQVLFAKIQSHGRLDAYSDFNIRSRHLRCIESFYVELDSEDRIVAVVTTSGLQPKSRTLHLTFLSAHLRGQDPIPRVSRLLDSVLAEASKYTPVTKLRCAYLYDQAFESPIGCDISDVFVHQYQEIGLTDEALVAHETGKNRDAILRCYKRK